MPYVFAPEGIYQFTGTVRAYQLFQHDLNAFFKGAFANDSTEYESAVMECKQPVPTHVRPELTYLHCLLHEPKRWFQQLCNTNMDAMDMALEYIRLVMTNVHLQMELFPRTSA